jgi:hypothetical protein
MWALVKSGSIDTIYGGGRTVIINNIKWPKEIFTLWTDSEREAIGVYTIVRKDQPDSNFYDVGTPSFTYNSGTDKVVEDFDITEKNLTKLKADHKFTINSGAHGRIREYGWLAERYTFDNTKAIPSAVKTYVAAVRSHAETICTAVDGCSDLAAFKVVYAKIYHDDGEYNTGWPDNSSIISYRR